MWWVVTKTTLSLSRHLSLPSLLFLYPSLSSFCRLQDPDKLHPGHGLFYEFHRNQGGNQDNVLLHALGQWRITPAFHDICFLPNIAVSKPLLIITPQVGILSIASTYTYAYNKRVKNHLASYPGSFPAHWEPEYEASNHQAITHLTAPELEYVRYVGAQNGIWSQPPATSTYTS